MKVREIVVNDCLDRPAKCSNWYQTNKRLKLEDSIRLRTLASVRSPSRLLQELEYLCIFLDFFLDSDLDFVKVVNSFKRLIHLEFGWLLLRPEELVDQKQLTLPQLRVLCTRNSIFRNQLILDTPKLQTVKSRQIEKLNFKYPATIKQLDAVHLDAIVAAKFKNLEVFRFVSIRPPLIGDILAGRRRLKELNFELNCRKEKAVDEYNEFKSFLIRTVRQASPESGVELKIYFNEVLLADTNQLEDFNFVKNQFNFQMKNYRLLRGPITEVTHANYNQLIGWHRDLSNDFFLKFPSIQTVKATDEVNPDRFLWFLKNVRLLSNLQLIDTSLSQAFLENLPNVIQRLLRLQISESRASSLINFNFILQIKGLGLFRTNLPFKRPLDLAAKMFEKFGGFHQFEFNADGDERIAIRRDFFVKALFELAFFEASNAEKTFSKSALSWDELVTLCEERQIERVRKRPRLV